jgi:hypothetical protein
MGRTVQGADCAASDNVSRIVQGRIDSVGQIVPGRIAPRPLVQVLRRRGGSEEERWLNGSALDCKSVVLGSNPAPPQHMANSISPEVGSHLG